MIGSSLLAAGLPALAALASASPAAPLSERTFTPLACLIFGDTVSPWWLKKCQPHLNLVVIDLRSAAEYAASHIPGSVSLPFEPVSAWSDMGPGDLLLEMPPSAQVFAALGAAGVSNPSPATKIVLVNGVGVPAFPQAASPRVATTLKYAGISEGRVAVLDGGFPAWESETYPVTTVVPVPVAATFSSTEDRSFLVDKEYVRARINRKSEHIYLIDGRDAAVYNGSVLEEWALKPGHIPSAVNLPAKDVWNADGSWKSPLELLAQLRSQVGYGVSRSYGEIVVYCGVGGYASTWYFVLTRILGFDNVKMYDGSAQEWSQYYDMEL
ncbi:Rhodanese-like domain-containing protein [Podospora aff. communis PSN243]|uniref:Rhodanese-like domain-containing protein n=1 Tax=Podospora aff. communis PSN243 TaxID=3040156 RepID=A0AAV9G7J6_9PEZI|nr:Rhodanese-like domain-containing protein [Podospora aff. communis PSN243]